jgi:hypothetical protein
MQPVVQDSKVPSFIRDLFEYKLQSANVLISAVCVTLAGFLIGAAGEWHGVLLKTWGFWLLFGSAITSVLLTIKTGKNDAAKQDEISSLRQNLELVSDKVKSLENENEKLKVDYEQLVHDQLSLIFYKMGLSKNERISVYKHDGKNRHFVLIGRYVSNPEYAKKSRPTYPDSEGFIMKGWQESELACSNLPDPNRFNQYYNAVNKISPIPKRIVERIRMKSRCFYVRSIRNPTVQMPVAVVVVESLLPNGFSIADIKGLFEEGEERRLFSFVEKMVINSVQTDAHIAQLLGL